MLKHLGFLLAGLLLASTATAAEPAAAAPATWEAGKNYFLIDPPQPTSSGDKVEVLEVFSYACPHCAHFQPYAEQIKQSLPDYAAFGYMPAIFNAQWEPYARAFYAAQSLGVLEQTHQALFDALHRDHLPLRTIDDLAGFYAGHGVDKAKFLSSAASFEVESKLQHASEVVRNAGVDGTPSILVAGKYRLTGQSAGGYPQMIELVGFLVKKEHDEHAKPAKAASKKK
ncbi:thiol:disulfide interchange protein DsbA/DsbL [Dokdonella fugitiva]|jgi:thiol:disulfide interchange protein DsbA|uniref:thiol:disulfide interchange protein DsbA/DsbL n=1 Tax=Dokdonella fugitiva TaxID=328517 RepID=UPI0015F7A7B7|nr:thiol:disulfide interchange protein DsbA/DsbL [Dokdonella fugitiva]MBA8883519.1 thiol:disulfide interchange protein DsbA [Dokdonella fugitiva]